MKKLLLLMVLLLIMAACARTTQTETPASPPDPQDIHEVLDDWHAAAAEGDFERYFNHFVGDSSIFMGTDATERWTVAEFRPWSKPYFEDDGVAWTFTPTFRKVYFSDEGSTAWFDEELDTPNLGPSRGSGVLVKNANGWKIAHYNLTIPIPNAIVDTVVLMVETELQQSNQTE